MKPHLIASFPDKKFQLPTLDIPETPPGRLTSRYCPMDQFDFPFLIKAADAAGYGLRSPVLRDPCEFVDIQGAIRWHADDGIGLIAITLLDCRNDECLPVTPELITKHGALSMEVGDMVVFDSRRDHGWISNDHCLLASMTVKRRRRR